MRTLIIPLLLVSFTAFSAPKAEKTKAAAAKKPSDKVEMLLTVGDVAEVRLAEILQKNAVDEVSGGKVVGQAKIYQTDKETVTFYAVDVHLSAGPAKELEKITAENSDKKLQVKVGGKVLHESRIRDIISNGVLRLEPARPKYNAKSDGSKESAQSKAAAEKLAKEIEKKLLKVK